MSTEDVRNQISQKLKEATMKKGLSGVVALAEHSEIPYQRAVRVWKSEENPKINDVIEVLASVGLQLKVVKLSGDSK